MVTTTAKDMQLSWSGEWPDFGSEDIPFTNPRQVPENLEQRTEGDHCSCLLVMWRFHPYHQHLPDKNHNSPLTHTTNTFPKKQPRNFSVSNTSSKMQTRNSASPPVKKNFTPLTLRKAQRSRNFPMTKPLYCYRL